ncbi:MAG: DNA primase [Planctomycetaceae bacterium]|nr:DNA primase [Planctomycetaceae bacterium]
MLGGNDDFKELVRAKTDLVALIGESVALQPERGGRAFKALCPFHPDTNPSFTVSPERQTYRCWACNEGGDCFSFLMKAESLSFPEALELLAKRAGLEMPRRSPSDRYSASKTTTLYEVMAWAEDLFHQVLLNEPIAEAARKYLQSRGFSAETISRCKLGFHPRQTNQAWLMSRTGGRFTAEQLAEASLARKRDDGHGYGDFFGDRVMFPIRDERQRVVAFGGRVLPDSESWTRSDGTVVKAAKYKNSAETPVFQKSKTLYGLPSARDAISRSGTAVVVEGYTDCIKCHQAGLWNVVGSLGTAFTETQVQLLRRFARRVILLFDGDEAGQRAAERALPKFLSQDVDLRVLLLPDELDPDEFLHARGPDNLRQLLDEAPEGWEFWWQILRDRHDMASLDGRLRVAEGMLALLAEAPGMAATVRETALIEGLSRKVSIAESELRKRLQQLRRDAARAHERRKPSPTGSSDAGPDDELRRAAESLQQARGGDDVLECELLKGVLASPRMIEDVRALVGPDHFRNAVIRELVCSCFDLADHGEEPTFSRLLASVESPVLKGVLVWLDDQSRNEGQGYGPAKDAAKDPHRAAEQLRSVANRLKWRQERDSLLAERSRQEVGKSLNDKTRDLLRSQFAVYRNPAGRKTAPAGGSSGAESGSQHPAPS